ncbi:MAG: 50S ribosomal protein L10 [Chloroflexi bacterium]|nr:50S ribosomal protein L10 [Chloroflexota bacterium]
MPTTAKVTEVGELRLLIRDAQIAISTGYQGISVGEQVVLRRRLTEAGAEMRVIKNTLLRIAARDEGLDAFGELAQGPTALVISREDVTAPARVLAAYLREHPASPVEMRGAVVEGKLVDAAFVQELAAVPPREELLGRIAGGVVGPLVEFTSLLQAATREFAGLIEARAAQLEGAAG